PIAAIPGCQAGVTVPLGKFLVVSPLNDAYLNTRSQDDASLSLALVSRAGVLARFPSGQPSRKTLDKLADEVLASGSARQITANKRFAWAQPVLRSSDDNSPIIAPGAP